MGRGQELLDAAREGHSRTVEKILSHINKRSGPFPSLRRGAVQNVQDDNGYTPLHHACLNGHREIVSMLLANNASPCIVDKKGATPLHLAAFKGDAQVVEMLLSHNNPPVNVDQLTHDGDSPLLMAAPFGSVNVVSQLVAAGADVSIQNANGDSALDLAAQYGKINLVKYLLHVKPQLVHKYISKIEYPSTPLHRASMNGRTEVVIALLEAGMDPNVRTAKGSPLHEAVSYEQASVVRVLLQSGADIYATDSQGKTVLDILDEYPAAMRKVNKIIQEHRANMSTYDTEIEDMHTFPYSPTPTTSKLSPISSAKLSNKSIASTLNNLPDNHINSVTNSFTSNKPTRQTHSPDNIDREFIKTLSPHAKRGNNSLQILEKTKESSVLQIQGLVINEFQKMKMGSADSNVSNDNGTHYENLESLTLPDPECRKRSITVGATFKTTQQIANTFEYNTLKKKPLPSPKPPIHSTDELDTYYSKDCSDTIYANPDCHVLHQYSTDGLYENLPPNLSDDVKIIRTSNIVGEDFNSKTMATIDSSNDPENDSYVVMGGKSVIDTSYVTVGAGLDSNSNESDNTLESESNTSYVIMKGRIDSDSDDFTQDELYSDSLPHIRGEVGCVYRPIEHVYEINPKAFHSDAYPFIKKEQKSPQTPCFCRKTRDQKANMLNLTAGERSIESQPAFSSCLDIYEPVSPSAAEVESSIANDYVYSTVNDFTCSPNVDSNTPEEENMQYSDSNLVDYEDTQRENVVTSESRLVRVLTKKFNQVKVLVADWKTSEIQKNTNKNYSLLSSSSSSSVTKKHTQSFVKKLASKCLGLKAKFNSAPNISNSSAAEVDVKSKQLDHRTNTNTLLIGNSKFFKMLSKKEEAGEIVCTDEFDTISLDRLGTLSRDSVVNRSNRSCPGFKTSLPNISENNELSDSQESIPKSIVITQLDCEVISEDITQAVNYNAGYNIFEPRDGENRKSVISTVSSESRHIVNECYESYDVHENVSQNVVSVPLPVPPPRPTVIATINDNTIYENVVLDKRTVPKPAARIHIPLKPLDDEQTKILYENVTVIQEKQPEPLKRTLILTNSNSNSINEGSSTIGSRSSTMSSESMVDETNLEDILLSEKSKSFRHKKASSHSYTKLQISRTQSFASDSSDVTAASALENVDCSGDTDEKSMYLSMTGTLPNKKPENITKKKVLFRHKTFTNIEADRNSIKVKDLPEWNNVFLNDTLASYHIRGTGHCVYEAPSVKEFIYIFNRDTLHTDDPPFTKVPNNRRDSEFETAICFCKPQPRKFHSSAEDLLDKINQDENEKVSINLEALYNKCEILSSSFKCYCDSGSCALHSTRRDSPINLVVKFSAIKKSISTPDITLDFSPYSTALKSNLPKNKSVPNNLEEPYAIVNVEDIISRKSNACDNLKDPESPIYTPMSNPSTLSSSTSARPYSIKDIAEVISMNDRSTSTTTTLSNASGVQLPLRKSSSSEYSGHWSLQSCNSNITIQSDTSFKTCLEDSSDDSDGTLHSDAESSDAETVKSDVSTSKRPWVHSDSFRFGGNSKPEIDVILEEDQNFPDDKSQSSKYESGVCLEGSVSSSSECEDDSGIPRNDGDNMLLGCASLERVSGLVGGVRSGSGRRRWDEAEGTSEGDALSVSSAASSNAPLHLTHHHPYSKVSPTPPKKPPRRNLSVSPTHANSPSSGYSYELRPHARSQDDLDDIQGAKHYLKHGRSVDQYVDSKLSYSEYEENHNSPRVVPVPNPRPSLKHRSQPVAITAMYENIVIKEQNPRRKLRRNNLVPSQDNNEHRIMDHRVRKHSHQERSSLESLLDDQSMNSPSDCERFYDGPRGSIPLSPTHYTQPPTPDHPPPSAKQAENCIHERIRPLSQVSPQ